MKKIGEQFKNQQLFENRDLGGHFHATTWILMLCEIVHCTKCPKGKGNFYL